MSDHESADSDSDYQYASAFFYFYKSLKILAMEAHEQCEAMGNFNVAWELKDDVLNLGSAILISTNLHIEGKDKIMISDILNGLRLIPREITEVDNISKKHLDSMENPVWTPLRLQSRDLIGSLANESQRTNLILWP